MKLATYEYVPVAHWCRSVSAPHEMFEAAGNLVYFGEHAEELPLKPPDFRVDTGVPDDIFAAARDYGMQWDPLTLKKLPPPDKPFLARLENVRVDKPNFSVFLDRHLVMAESYHDLESSEDSKTWYGPYATRRSARFDLSFAVGEDQTKAPLEVKYYLDREADLKLDMPAMLLSGTSFYNYHHWTMEILPRLSWCERVPELQRLPIVVHGPLAPFQSETLRALGIGAERLIYFEGWMLQAPVLYFPSYVTAGNLSIRNVEWVRDRLLRAFGLERKEPRALLYVSRRNAASRRILNEPEVIAELEKRGFKSVTLEDMSVRDQAALFASAKVVVMPHGAAATNMIFAPPGAALIEIMPKSGQHILYWVYSVLNGGRYGRLIFDDSAHPETKDVTVDPRALRAMLDQAHLAAPVR